MIVLVDNAVKEFDSWGYELGLLNNGTPPRRSRLSWHRSVADHSCCKDENRLLISCGNAYYLNYNKETFGDKKILTFEDYKNSVK